MEMVGNRVNGGERRRSWLERKGKGAPVGNLDGAMVGKLRESSGTTVLALSWSGEDYGGLSTCVAMAAVERTGEGGERGSREGIGRGDGRGASRGLGEGGARGLSAGEGLWRSVHGGGHGGGADHGALVRLGRVW